MKTKSLLIYAIIIICLLTACSAGDKSSSDIELHLVNENLKLKEEIFDLESKLEETINKEREEQAIESRIISFFYYINEGNMEEVQRRTTDKILIVNNSVQLPDGRKIYSDTNSPFAMQMIQSEWQGDNTCEATLSVLVNKNKEKLKVSLIKSGNEWRIDDFHMVTKDRKIGSI